MEYKDYYSILGVPKGADEAEVKKAYRKLAKQHHPDRNPGDKAAEAKFKEISEAYEVLSDPEKRKLYEQFGSQWQGYQRAGASGHPGAGGSPFGQNISPEDFERIFGQGFRGGGGRATSGGAGQFSDFFETLFGGGMGGRGGRTGFGGGMPQQLPSQQLDVEITLEEAFQGTTRQLSRADGPPLTAKIPKGVKTGSKVKLSGAVNGQDVYLVMTVLPHGRYERDGDDLRLKVPVDLYTAILGGPAEVAALDKTVTLTIPAGTPNGRAIRLRGLGMPKLGQSEERGDLYATIEVQLPTQLSAEEKALFEQLRTIRQ
ncbi:MAG: J domain-containing protein [Chloroflexi bacterium]|nr:J domain-containing protein [Chloroflexota bacterium]